MFFKSGHGFTPFAPSTSLVVWQYRFTLEQQYLTIDKSKRYKRYLNRGFLKIYLISFLVISRLIDSALVVL